MLACLSVKPSVSAVKTIPLRLCLRPDPFAINHRLRWFQSVTSFELSYGHCAFIITQLQLWA